MLPIYIFPQLLHSDAKHDQLRFNKINLEIRATNSDYRAKCIKTRKVFSPNYGV